MLATAPITGTLLMVGAVAITGVPPLSLFVSEFGIVVAGVEQAMWPVVTVVVALLAVSFVAIINQTLQMVLGSASKSRFQVEFSALQRAALLLPLGGMGLMGLMIPAPVTAALNQAVAQLLSLAGPGW